MRLQQVRDWLAGQSWFDTRQYRVLPPEGISMHWSRYIDAGIAAILVPASWLLSPTGAEHAAVILWPTLLACLMVLVIGHAYHRNTAAFWNGVGAFQGRNDLRDALASSRADHLVVCVGAGEESIITRLADDTWPDWLTEVTGDRQVVRAFKVDQAALARDRVTP
jgi:hypothetical protein